MVSWICAWFLLIAASVQGDKVLRVLFSSPSEAKEFRYFSEIHNLDIWSFRESSADVAVTAAQEAEVKRNFRAKDLVLDVERKIEKEMKENKKMERMARRFRAHADPISYFARYSTILLWLRKLSRKHNFVSLRPIGRSHEDRRMVTVRIGIGREGSKPAVFVIGGIHAREWLGVATANFLIHRLVQGLLHGEKRIKHLVNKYDFYISPVSNPDGYEYSHVNCSTRSWRKTRRRYQTQKGVCVGADPNRNFPVGFGQPSFTNHPCNIIYPGPHPFSEKCTQNLRDFALSPKIRGRIKLFYDIHAFSQMYLSPFAYTKEKPADDYEVRRVARISNEALFRVNNRVFLLGSPPDILYVATGVSMDWFKLYAGVNYTYSFEVYPPRYSKTGYLSRPADIIPSGKEISEAIFTAAENIRF